MQLRFALIQHKNQSSMVFISVDIGKRRNPGKELFARFAGHTLCNMSYILVISRFGSDCTTYLRILFNSCDSHEYQSHEVKYVTLNILKHF